MWLNLLRYNMAREAARVSWLALAQAIPVALEKLQCCEESRARSLTRVLRVAGDVFTLDSKVERCLRSSPSPNPSPEASPTTSDAASSDRIAPIVPHAAESGDASCGSSGGGGGGLLGALKVRSSGLLTLGRGRARSGSGSSGEVLAAGQLATQAVMDESKLSSDPTVLADSAHRHAKRAHTLCPLNLQIQYNL